MSGVKKIYIGGLPDEITEPELEEEFKRFGHIYKIWIARSPPGFAFIEYDDRRDAEDAIRGMHEKEFRNKRLTVEFARERDGRRDERRDGGRGGDRRDDRDHRGGDDRRRDDRSHGGEERPEQKCYNCNGLQNIFFLTCRIWTHRS